MLASLAPWQASLPELQYESSCVQSKIARSSHCCKCEIINPVAKHTRAAAERKHQRIPPPKRGQVWKGKIDEVCPVYRVKVANRLSLDPRSPLLRSILAPR